MVQRFGGHQRAGHRHRQPRRGAVQRGAGDGAGLPERLHGDRRRHGARHAVRPHTREVRTGADQRLPRIRRLRRCRRSGRSGRRQHRHMALGMVPSAGQGVPAGGQEGRYGRSEHSLRPRTRAQVRVRSGGTGMEGRRLPGAANRRDRLGALCRGGPKQGSRGPVALPGRQHRPLLPGDDDSRLSPSLRHPRGPVLQLDDQQRRGRQPRPPAGLPRDIVVAARNGLAEPFDRTARQRHAHLCQGRRRRLRRRGGRGIVALVGQVRLGVWHRPDGLMCPEPRRRHEELGRWRHSGTDSELEHVQSRSHRPASHCSRSSPTSSSTTRRSPIRPSPSGTAIRRTSCI